MHAAPALESVRPLMSPAQQRGGWQWRLGAGEAVRLAAQPRRRYLAVREGRVWLTGSAGADGNVVTGDVWLDAGAHQPVDCGVELVVEAWPSARFELIEAPAASPAAPRPLRAWVSRVFGGRRRGFWGRPACA